MLPLQQAREVRDSVIEYIKATFRFKEKDVSDAFFSNKPDGVEVLEFKVVILTGVNERKLDLVSLVD